MSDTYASAVISPDGRFEVTVEETPDRFEMICKTVLLERATGQRLFACDGAWRAEFAANGMLTIHYPGYEPGGVQIDPARAVFRMHPSGPWVPLAAWQLVEDAYRRGWARAMDYRTQSRQTVFPWGTLLLLLASVAALLVLSAQTLFAGEVRIALIIVAGVGVLFFGWLAAGDLRAWAQIRKLLRASHPE